MQNKAPHHNHFLAGGGEMGEHIRHFDWSKTSLGDPEHWDPSLKTIVRIMLTSQQPIWIGWGSDLIKLYNDPYKAIVGGKHPHALGQPALEVWKEISDVMKPLLHKVMYENEGTYTESQLLIMHRNGYPEETYYTFSYSPVPGADGKTAGMICYNTDDTGRMINERALRTLRELGTMSGKNSLTEIYTTALDTLAANQHDFPFCIISTIDRNGLRATTLAARGIDKNHPEIPAYIELKDDDERFLTRAVKENRLVYFENKGQWQDLPAGTWNVSPHAFVHLPISVNSRKYPVAVLTLALNPFRKFDASYQNFVQLVADQISMESCKVLNIEGERKRAQELEELDQAKTLFFSNISHEFRTPLTLILGPIEEILNRSYSELTPMEKNKLTTIHNNALRLLRLVNSLLDFSRIETGRQKVQFSQVDIIGLTQNLASNFRSLAEKANLQLVIKTDAFMPPVYLDKNMWEKIVFNLLSNAYKYTLAGSITVELTSNENYAILKIKDTGVGIPENELPLIFERFHRVQQTQGRTHEGTGIGLSLIKELVHIHQGIIMVESQLGQGSCFIVKIPLGKEHLSSQQLSQLEYVQEDVSSNIYIDHPELLLAEAIYEETTEQPQQELHTVMVVDDNADMRFYLKSLLDKRYNIVTANNGLDALHKIIQAKPDLVLSDIMMPIMDGVGLLREIKKNMVTKNIPVIFLTARAGEESRIEGWDTGADDYLVKPFSSRELLARINAQIETHRLRKQTEEKFKNILLQSPGIFGILKGPQMEVDFVNQALLDSWGRDWNIIGKPLLDSLPELKDQAFYKTLKQVFKTGETCIRKGEKALIRKQGTLSEIFCNYVYLPMTEKDGAVYGVAIMATDITEQTRAMSKVTNQEQHVKNLFEQTPIGIAVMKGQELELELVNPTMLTYWGRTHEQVIGRPLWQVLPEVKAQGFDLIAQKVYETGERYVSPLTPVQVNRNGKLDTLHITFAIVPRRDVNGKINGLLGIANEVNQPVVSPVEEQTATK